MKTTTCLIRVCRVTALGFVLLVVSGNSAHAQWTTSGTNTTTTNNVGVGTDSPGELLSVNNGAIGTYFYKPNYAIRGIFQHGGNGSGISNAGGLQIASQGTNNAANGSGDINFFVTSSNSTGAFTDGSYTQAMKIRYDGNVGIGTNSPIGKLHINGSVYSAATETDSVFNGAGSWGNTANFVGTGAYWALRTATNHGVNLDVYNDGSPLTALSIAQGGNVGIGTTNPNAPLNVISASSADQALVQKWGYTATNNDIYNLTLKQTVTSGVVRWTFNQVNANTAYSNLLTFDRGNVGIGTTNPNAPLNVISASSGDQALVQKWGYTPANNDTYNLTLKQLVTSGVVRWTFDQVNNNTAYPNLLTFDRGSVGIGTTSPASKLDIAGNIQISANSSTNYVSGKPNLDLSGLFIWHDNATKQLTPTGIGVAVNRAGTAAYFTNAGGYSAIFDGGNVGIGTLTPTYKLDVNGNTNITGNITASGSIAAKYQDVAEWVPASEQLSAGTVVVLDATKSNQVTSSTVSYDTRVAGVVSTQPGIALGEKSDNKVLVATTGRVRVKVDATKNPIHIGDLLVTSDIPGVAMKSEPVNLGGVEIHRPGTLIGKALEPLEKGKGEVLVLLSLQ
jgi:hypothetical protein